MSDSDILAIQLWIGAAAIAMAAIAMTAAGWNHRYFVRGMFVLGALLALLAIFWRSMQDYLPARTDEFFAAVATNQLAWLAMSAAGIGSILLVAMARISKTKAGVPRAIPTRLRLQFNAGNITPTALDMTNIWRWYALTTIIKGADKKGKLLEHRMLTIFIVFDAPVSFKQIVLDPGGAALPIYEVKDTGPRHAIIVLQDAIPGIVLEIRASL